MTYKSKKSKASKRSKKSKNKSSKRVKKYNGGAEEYESHDEHHIIPKEVLEEASEAAAKVIHDYLLKNHNVVQGSFSPLLIPVAMKYGPKAFEMAKKYGPKAMDMAKKYGPGVMNSMQNAANKE
jgi:hypothetical protein